MRLGVSGRAVARACAAIAALALGASTFAGGSSVAEAAPAATPPKYMAAAEYFGDANPYTLWSSTLNGAPAAFAQMKSDGFNTVGLVLPWGEFQPGLTPVRYDATSFHRLNELIEDADKLGMGVILRLSYDWDVDQADQKPFSARFQTLWGTSSKDKKIYAAWLDYIGKVHQTVTKFHNVREAYISWEDLWQPVFDAQQTTTPAGRLALAASSGYRSWLASTSGHSLAKVSTDYGADFTSWSQVPTPPATQPSFRLMYQYQDWALVHRLFVPASDRFPGLTMETRVDVDAIYNGTGVTGSYGHSVQYKLPGTTVTGMYFSPYMGDPSSTPVETTAEALVGLQSTLSRISTDAAGRKLFIYEYEIVSNSPAVAADPALTPDDVSPFITQSEPLLAKYTTGYALWLYRDCYLSPVYNQAFALGAAGWTLSGGARAVPSATGQSYAALPNGASVSQKLIDPLVTPKTPAVVSIEATAPAATTLSVSDGPQSASLTIQPGWHTYHLTMAATAATRLTVAAASTAKITNLQISSFTQLGDVYTVTDQPEAAAAALRAVNDQLVGKAG